jgi:hypothetical protein
MSQDDPPRPFRPGRWFWFWLIFGLACVIAGALTAYGAPRLFPAAQQAAVTVPSGR